MTLKRFFGALLACAISLLASSVVAQQPMPAQTAATVGGVDYRYSAFVPMGVIPPIEYNYYYPPPGGYMPARLYLCPVPVPPHVGYTYITYQAFAPHQYLYQHSAVYGTYHPGSGMTITRISWR